METLVGAESPNHGFEMPVRKTHRRRRLSIVVIAVLVAAIVVGSSTIILLVRDHSDPEPLTVTIKPQTSQILVNESVVLDAAIALASESVGSSPSTSTVWKAIPESAVTISSLTKSRVSVKASLVPVNVTISCFASFEGHVGNSSSTIEIMPDSVKTFEIWPSSRFLLPGEQLRLDIHVVRQSGKAVPGLPIIWRVAGTSPDCISIDSTEGTSTNLTAICAGNATVIASTKYDGTLYVATSQINVSEPWRVNAVDYRWYDMFNVPFEPWWQNRWDQYGAEQPLTNTYPYIFRWHGSPPGNDAFCSNARLNITGIHLTSVNMDDRPIFLPRLGLSSGGLAHIDWEMQYLTMPEASKKVYVPGFYDGWLVCLNGTVVLDEAAAKDVLGVTDDGFDDFGTWWTANNATVSQLYRDWVVAQGFLLDVHSSYGNDLEIVPGGWVFWCEKSVDEIVVHIDIVSYGIEILLAGWVHEAFNPTEWYYEDMDFHAQIGPSMSDFSIDTAVIYALEARDSMELPGNPCWVWRAQGRDLRWTSNDTGPPIYHELEHECGSVGSHWYGRNVSYDYAPTAFNLSSMDTLTFEWPAGQQQLIQQARALNGTPILGETLNLTSELVVHPVPSSVDSDSVSIDGINHTLKFKGPLNAWDWAKTQTSHPWLNDMPTFFWGGPVGEEADVLPFGVPWIEFCNRTFPPPFRYLELEVSPNTMSAGTPTDVTVTVWNSYATIVTDYSATIHFSSSDPLAVLPGDYSFTPSDAGVHVFHGVTFGTPGVQTISAQNIDTNHPDSGTAVVTVLDARRPDHLQIAGLPSTISPGTGLSPNVTVYDQFGGILEGYNGTLRFGTNGTSVVLPDDYHFNGSDRGSHVFVDGLVISDLGYVRIECWDTSNASVNASVSLFVVGFDIPVHFRVFTPATAVVDEWIDVTVVVLDRYDRTFDGYNGTIAFFTNASVGNYTIPANYTFDPFVDMGNKTFHLAVRFTVEGTFEVSVADISHSSYAESAGIVIEPYRIDYRLYDMFEEPYGQWWWGHSSNYSGRIVKYGADAIIWNETHKHVNLKILGDDHAILMAPYHWSTDAGNLASVTVSNPYIMPSRYVDWQGTPAPTVAGAEVKIDLYMQYIGATRWDSDYRPMLEGYDIPPTIVDPFMKNQGDGYVNGVTYHINMNREAALQWLNLSLSTSEDDILPYWDSIYLDYEIMWREWVVDQANNPLNYDIYPGYGDNLYATFFASSLSVDHNTGDVILKISFVNWGFEILMTKWLGAAGVCGHETWWENFTLNATISSNHADVRFDGTSFYNLHAVRANESLGVDGAWVWEPTIVDYLASWEGPIFHPSRYDIYKSLTYTSWNSGDPLFGTEVAYESTPQRFNLDPHMSLTIELPTSSAVPCFVGQGVPIGSIEQIRLGNASAYNSLMYNGTMTLGYWISGGPDLDSVYDAVTKTMTMMGPLQFENPRGALGGPLYHGAPWIEFNVTSTQRTR